MVAVLPAIGLPVAVAGAQRPASRSLLLLIDTSGRDVSSKLNSRKFAIRLRLC